MNMTEGEWLDFFRGRSSWIYANGAEAHEFHRYFTRGKAYRLAYADFKSKDVWIVDDRGREWPISYNELIGNFECLEDMRDGRLGGLLDGK